MTSCSSEGQILLPQRYIENKFTDLNGASVDYTIVSLNESRVWLLLC